MKQKDKVGELILYYLISKLTLRLSNQDSVIWDKDRHRNQWNRIESSEIDVNVNGPLIFAENAKINQ